MVKRKACIFISGKGSNLKNLILRSRDKSFPVSISLVISNNKNAIGIDYAKKYKIPYKIINTKIKNHEVKLLYLLKKYKISFICLAGYMKIISNKIIQNFEKKIINIHPSLLPKFKGLNTHLRAIKNNEKYSGCTVHYVNSKLDSGKIILQKKIKVMKKDDEKSLAKRLLKVENNIYPKALKKFILANL